ncbi:MAG: hypothetical protein ACK5L5_00390 [Bacteroidales bacterium]
MRLKLLIIVSLCFFCEAKAQLTGLFEGSIGGQGSESVWDIAFALGHTFEDNRTFLYGGLKLQEISLSGKSHLKDSSPETKEYMPIPLFVGARYNFPIKNYDPEKHSIEVLGIYPEVRLYWTPRLPFKYSYKDLSGELQTVKSEKMSQLAYGLGFGFYFGSKDGCTLSLKFEYSSIDMMESLRMLKKDGFFSDYGKSSQFMITLSFYLRNL